MAYKPGNGVMDYNSTLGPNPYNHAGRPTLQFPHIKTIRAIEDVHIDCQGWIVDIVSIAGNTATFRVSYPTQAHTHIFAGVPLAAHTHDLFLNNAEVVDGANTRVNAGADLLGANTGGDLTVTGVLNVAGHGGVVGVSAGTVAGANAPNVVAAGSEVQFGDTVNMGGMRFYGEAFGYPANNGQ